MNTKRFIVLLFATFNLEKVVTDDKLFLNYEELVQIATEIVKRNFDHREKTIVVTKGVDPVLVNVFLRSYNGTVIVDIYSGMTTKQVVIIVQSYDSFMGILENLKPDLKGKSLLYSGSKFLIVILAPPYRLERLNHVLWSYYATDVIILIKDHTRKPALYTFFPYKDHKNCQNMEPRSLGYWYDRKILYKDLYPDKMGNMQGCPLYISTDKLYNPVTDQKVTLQMIKKTIVRLLRDTMNFTPMISNKDYVSIDSGQAKNWSDALNDVISGAANISTCTVSLLIERVNLLDYSKSYFGIRLAWLAPPPEPISIGWRLFSPLNGYLWLVLLLIIVFVKSLPFMVKFKKIKRFCYRHFRNFDQVHSVAFRSWGVMMGQPIKVAPRRFRDFYLISLWLWFTFVIRSAYQSVLIGALKSEVFEGKFTSIQEATEYGYRFGGREDVLTHFEHEPFIKNGFEIVPENEYIECFREVLEGKKRFVFAMFLEYAWAYCLSQGLSENECGYVIPDSIMTAPLVIWMKKNSPFNRPISFWLNRFLESGLLEKDTMNNPLMSSIKVPEPSALTRDQMLSCIMCLLVGYLICIVIFVVEVIRFRTKKTKGLDMCLVGDRLATYHIVGLNYSASRGYPNRAFVYLLNDMAMKKLLFRYISARLH